MLILVSENPVGYEVVEYKGVVFGSGKTMENKDASEVAIDVMTEMATKIGANAVINVNISAQTISQFEQITTVYGDAVLLKKEGADELLGDNVKQKVRLEAYLPKQKPASVGKLLESNGYKFVVCPNCGTKYRVEIDPSGNVSIKGFEDVDSIEKGLQVYCLKCGSKFTVPQVQ